MSHNQDPQDYRYQPPPDNGRGQRSVQQGQQTFQQGQQNFNQGQQGLQYRQHNFQQGPQGFAPGQQSFQDGRPSLSQPQQNFHQGLWVAQQPAHNLGHHQFHQKQALPQLGQQSQQGAYLQQRNLPSMALPVQQPPYAAHGHHIVHNPSLPELGSMMQLPPLQGLPELFRTPTAVHHSAQVRLPPTAQLLEQAGQPHSSAVAYQSTQASKPQRQLVSANAPAAEQQRAQGIPAQHGAQAQTLAGHERNKARSGHTTNPSQGQNISSDEQVPPVVPRQLSPLEQDRKRKQPEPADTDISEDDKAYYAFVGEESFPAPPPPIQTQAVPRQAGVFNQIMAEPDLIMPLISQCDLVTLKRLVNSSPDLWRYLRTGWTHCLKSWAMEHCPINWNVAKFTQYRDKCFEDPSGGLMKNQPLDAPGPFIRQAPRSIYLDMIHHRECTIRSVVRQLAACGHRLPSRAKFVLARLWLLMDVPLSARRQELIRMFFKKSGKYYWSDEDLIIATMFFLKLDMRFSDNVKGGRYSELRDMMLAQRGFTILDEFLRGDSIRTQAELLVLKARWKFNHVPHMPENWRLPDGRFNPAMMEKINFLGMPWTRLGVMSREGWLQGRNPLIGLAELIASECVRRDFDMPKLYVSMVAWGHVDKYGRPIDFLKEDEDEDLIDDRMEPIRVGPELLRQGEGHFKPIPDRID